MPRTCRTCDHAFILRQQCRRNAPSVFPAMTNRGPVPFTAFPGLPPDDAGCGEWAPAEASELERRDREHPITTRVVEDPPAKPRLVT